LLLAIDTSTRWTGLALFDGVEIIGELIWQTRNHHTVELAPAIQELQARCGLKTADLQAIGVAQGPGSFTSLRIGMAIAKGMALALHIPVIGVPTLDILAAAQPVRALPMAAVLQAGRGRLAVGWYTAESLSWKPQGEVQVMSAADLSHQISKPTLICGELSASDRQVLGRKHKNAILAPPAQTLRRPSYLAELAWNRWKAGLVESILELAPVYLHTSEAIPG